ncbi:MAG: hypothetical protein RRY41_08630 [Burkholderiaceae bacterium]
MANSSAPGVPLETSIESWLAAAFRAERLPRRRRAAYQTPNPITAPLRPAGVGLIYWVSLAATLAAWLAR